MSAIISADDLNDFISPGVACIKPVETLPKKPEDEVCALILHPFYSLQDESGQWLIYKRVEPL